MFEMEFKLVGNFIFKIKGIICLRLSEPAAKLAAQTTPYTLRPRLSKQAFVEVNGKNIYVKETCKITEIQGRTFLVD